MKLALALLLGALLVGGGLAVAYLTPEHAYSDEELRAFGFVAYPEPRAIPPFDLADAGGGRFAPERLRGRWSLLFFGFANCPDICPTTMSTLALAEERLLAAGDPAFQGVLVTVDPERDTPAALSRYVGAFSEAFVGVTGPVPAIHAFATSMHAGFTKAPVDDPTLGYLMDHSARVAVVDPDGRHAGHISGPLEAQGIATLVRALTDRRADAGDPP